MRQNKYSLLTIMQICSNYLHNLNYKKIDDLLLALSYASNNEAAMCLARVPYRREYVFVRTVGVATVQYVDVVVLWQLDAGLVRGLTHVEWLLFVFPLLVFPLRLPYITRVL